MASRFSTFLAELKRRKVTRVAVVYTLVGIGVIEAADLILPRMTVPEVVLDILVLVVVLGFPIALVLAWAVDLTPEGIQRTPGMTPEELAAQGTGGWKASTWPLLGAAFVVVLAGGYFLFFRGGAPDVAENVSAETSVELVEARVAVMPFEDRTGREDLAALGPILADLLTEGLSRTELVEVVPTSVTVGFLSAAGSGSDEVIVDGRARTLAEETGAGTVIRGAYYVLGDSLRIQAEITDEATRTVLDAVEFSGRADSPMQVAGELRQRVLSEIALRFDPLWEEEDAESIFGKTPPRYEAYAAYMEALEASFGLSQNLREVLRHSSRAFEFDSTFFAPVATSLYAHISLGNVREADSVVAFLDAHRDELDPFSLNATELLGSRLRGDLNGEYQASRSWLQGQADFGQGLWQFGWAALNVNRPREALEVLEEADPGSWSLRGEVGYWASLTEAYHLLGRHDEGLAASRRGREQFPESADVLQYEFAALAALGEVDAVLDGLEELVTLTSGSPASNLHTVSRELRAHGHSDAARDVLNRLLSWYQGRPLSELDTQTSRYDRGITHYLAEEWEDAEALFAGIHAEALTGDRTEDRRRLVYSVGYLGVIAARRGDRAEALRFSEELANVEFLYLNGLHTLWRGRIAAVLGDREDAMALLLEAHAQGRPFGWSWHRDMDLESLRDYPPFREFMRPKG